MPLSPDDLLRRRSAWDSVLPSIAYPPQLPVSAAVDEIAQLIRDHQVVVVAGETGSGKTTQLPKICLALGRGVTGAIAHTQPRRIAARAVAERLAEELDVPLGEAVGYQVRFTRRATVHSLVKVMTDGVLLAEIARDRDLRAYDTIIIDEAHERSLNIDFLLGYLHRLLPRRPDLRVLITSATIEPQRFAEHFARDGVPAPIVEVSGRTYPVQVRYRPWADEDDDGDSDGDQVQAIIDAIGELAGEGPGDSLVFLSGEREIRDTAEALRRVVGDDVEVLPLFGRLSAAEQHQVFAAHSRRRIVLATNVAETSLTVPGIRYVVDAGTARISRYSTRLKVQRLPIEKISQASARQRAGRCGRVADGICVRLYSEEDHDARPAYTDPEIVRTNLAAVILRMADLGLGEIEDFPFLDAPDRRAVRDGVAVLEELGALAQGALTKVGRRMARLPLDPRLGRMVLAADDLQCVYDVVVVTAGLTIQDPRERPSEAQQKADEMHARFADPTSDVLALLNLWRYLEEQQSTMSSSAFRRMCRAEHLHYLRIREWQDLVAQLLDVVRRDLGMHVDAGGVHPDHLHRALLAGLLSHIGLKEPDGRGYLGARGAKFVLWPGSSLAGKPPRWVMAAELVETSRLFARTVASIDPRWVEQAGEHLLDRTYSEPHWDARRAAVMGYERVALYGIPLVARRRIGWARVDPAAARELFIRHALVEGEWQSHHRFLAHNRQVARAARSLEDKLRRRDVVDEEAVFDFYDGRVPSSVVSGRHFDAWWKSARRAQPDLLDLTLSDLAPARAEEVAGCPDSLDVADVNVPLEYRFAPGQPEDGVTARLPLALLNRVPASAFSWHVPARREELAVALIKSLPKELRRALVPAPDTARAALAQITPDLRTSFTDVFAQALTRVSGVGITAHAFSGAPLPPHLRMHVAVIGADGGLLATGDDLDALRTVLAPQLQRTLAAAAPALAREGLRAWPDGRLPTSVETEQDGALVVGYPALVDTGDAVAVRILASPAEQRAAMRLGTRRLLLLALPSPARAVLDTLASREKLALARDTDGRAADAVRDSISAAVDALVDDAGGPVWDAEGFARLRDFVAPRLSRRAAELLRTVAGIHQLAHTLRDALAADPPETLRASYDDMRSQLAALVSVGVATRVGAERIAHVPRYLQAMQQRVDRLPRDPGRDVRLMQRVHDVEDAWHDALDELPSGTEMPAALADVPWMLEELRVSLFAQHLGTAHPVSEKRILQVVHARA